MRERKALNQTQQGQQHQAHVDLYLLQGPVTGTTGDNLGIKGLSSERQHACPGDTHVQLFWNHWFRREMQQVCSWQAKAGGVPEAGRGR